MTTPEPQPEPGDEEWWADMAIAYNYGLIEPAEGTAEAEEAWRASRRGCAPQAGLEPEAGQ